MKRPLCILGLAAAVTLPLLLSSSAVVGAPESTATVQEVRGDEDDVSILIALGDKKVVVGQSVEVRRGSKTVGYGTVEQVFTKLAVASIGTVVDDAKLKTGDEVKFLNSGFKPGGKKPVAVKKPSGKVVSVRDGIVVLDFGREAGLEVGHLVVLRDPETNKSVGKLAVELIGEKSGGGILVSGKAEVGYQAVAVGRAKRNNKAGIDFVELDFLGAVANLEHPAFRRVPGYMGVPVRRVLPGSPAERAGIGRADRIIAVDGIVVRDIHSVRRRIQARKNDRVTTLILRGDRIVQVEVSFKR